MTIMMMMTEMSIPMMVNASNASSQETITKNKIKEDRTVTPFDVVGVTYDNFETVTAGKKMVFLKFYSPTCPHCQKMAKDWERLEQDYRSKSVGKEVTDEDQQSSRHILVASIDCGQQVQFCERRKILGVPTILYGDPSHKGVFLQEYKEDKSYEAMSKFVKKTLSQPICSPGNLEDCEEMARHRLMYFLSLGVWELESVIKDKLNAIQRANDEFQYQFDAMQLEYDDMVTNHELEKFNLQWNISALQSILKSRKDANA
jgi:thiol-disulfide isomerase/thioredoxin